MKNNISEQYQTKETHTQEATEVSIEGVELARSQDETLEVFSRSLEKRAEGFTSRMLGAEIYQDTYSRQQCQEIGILKGHFDNMAHSLTQYYNALAKRVVFTTMFFVATASFGQNSLAPEQPTSSEDISTSWSDMTKNSKNFYHEVVGEFGSPVFAPVREKRIEDTYDFMSNSPAWNKQEVNIIDPMYTLGNDIPSRQKLYETPDLWPDALEEYQMIKKQYDDVRAWSKDQIMTPAYQARLANELAQSNMVGMETFYSQKRLLNLSDKTYQLDMNQDILEDSDDGAFAYYNPTEGQGGSWVNNEAVRFPTEGVTHLPYEKTLDYEGVAAHEFDHESVDVDDLFGNEETLVSQNLITPHALSLYQEGINNVFWDNLQIQVQSGTSEINSEALLKAREYYSDPTEIQAYKRGAIYELEQLGIWDYQSEFTEEMYEKALEVLDQSDDSSLNTLNISVFFMTLKKEFVIRIMNETA
ncbi:hypothetical protein H6776_00455 [Candidatus Nomurabacteria bacterium]|nr:hypothetical protein [Candidatus Nomurabacteria bacterium]